MYADVRLEATPAHRSHPGPEPRASSSATAGRWSSWSRNSRAQWVYINPGRSNGADTEVLPDSSTGQIPVATGDTVLVEGHLTLTHDAPVRLVTKE